MIKRKKVKRNKEPLKRITTMLTAAFGKLKTIILAAASGKWITKIRTAISGRLKIIIPIAAAVIVLAVFAGLMLFTDVFTPSEENNPVDGNPADSPVTTGEESPQITTPDPPATGNQEPEPDIPGDGGQIRITGHTEIRFKPGESGVWDIRTADNGNSDPLILLLDQYDEVMYYNDNGEADMHDHYIDEEIDLNAIITTYLEAGITYTIEVRVYTDDDSIGSCTLIVSFIPEEVRVYTPIGLGSTAITEDSWFTFVPDISGVYEFRTSENDGSDPYMIIQNEDLSNIIYDDNSGGGFSAFASVELEAGKTYIIEIVFYIHGGEGSTLTITHISS